MKELNYFFDLYYDIKTEEQLRYEIVKAHTKYLHLLDLCKQDGIKVTIHSEWTDYPYSEGSPYAEFEYE